MVSNVVIVQRALCIRVLQAHAKGVLPELLNILVMNSLTRKVCAIHVAQVTTVNIQDREVVVNVKLVRDLLVAKQNALLDVLATQFNLPAKMCALNAKTGRLHMTVFVVVLAPKDTDTRVLREAVA
jgi:hypothetical protein